MRTTNTVDELPAYRRLADVLEDMIRSRSLRPGDRIPSVRAFSTQQRVSVPTALQAYGTLESRGLIEARPKSGFFVRPQLADLVREPGPERCTPKVTDLAEFDPLDGLLADHSNPDRVPLGAALPSPSLLPAARLGQMLSTVIRQRMEASIGYDVAPGAEELRREIARRSLDWGRTLKPEQLIITNGATEALSLALRVVCKPGDTVVVESPTYFGLAFMLRELGLKALPIGVDSSTGIDLNRLEWAITRRKIAACVLNPNFNNPSGFVMPDSHKKAVVDLHTRHQIPLVEDDIYGDLQHEGRRPRNIRSFDKEGWVLLCSSWSKSLAPGYRVGFIDPGRWYRETLRLKTSCSLANATAPTLAVAGFLRNGGYDRYLRTLRMHYREQVAKMREAIVSGFPGGIGLSRPTGGFLLWCELPETVDSVELFKRAQQKGISIAPGPIFSATGEFRSFIRINCGHPWDARMERAVNVLGDMVHGMM